jgi:hypothetical protein
VWGTEKPTLALEMLARQHNLPLDLITHLREMAIIQFLIDYKNIAGLQKLIDAFDLDRAERSRIFGLIEKEKIYPCFSFTKNTQLAINENRGEVWGK